MKITNKKLLRSNRIVTVEEEYLFRFQLEVGNMISLVVTIEDGEVMWIRGDSASDIRKWNKLSAQKRTDIQEILETIEF